MMNWLTHGALQRGSNQEPYNNNTLFFLLAENFRKGRCDQLWSQIYVHQGNGKISRFIPILPSYPAPEIG